MVSALTSKHSAFFAPLLTILAADHAQTPRMLLPPTIRNGASAPSPFLGMAAGGALMKTSRDGTVEKSNAISTLRFWRIQKEQPQASKGVILPHRNGRRGDRIGLRGCVASNTARLSSNVETAFDLGLYRKPNAYHSLPSQIPGADIGMSARE